MLVLNVWPNSQFDSDGVGRAVATTVMAESKGRIVKC